MKLNNPAVSSNGVFFAPTDNPFINSFSPNRLALCTLPAPQLEMGLPSQPVTLNVEQLNELNRKLSNMRHDINNTLSLIMAAVELIRHKPQMTERMLATLLEQPPKIADTITTFSQDFEKILGITRA
jgi:hypothetical protein